jgi:hypothetical protein
LESKIQAELIDLIFYISKANCRQEKFTYVQKASELIEVVKLFSLSKNLKLLDFKKFVEVSQMIKSVSKQLTAREKYQSNSSI